MSSKPDIFDQVSIFFFAHQDDEFGVYQAILDELENKRKVFCIYLTDGAYMGGSSDIRNSESELVLGKLGVSPENIIFKGRALNIPDAQLYMNLDTAAAWIYNFIRGCGDIVSIYVPAWEGGHCDHDALNAIVRLVCNQYCNKGIVAQFPLYNASGCIGPFFKVLSPLSKERLLQKKISLKNRIRFLLFCMDYRSQYKTWIGLFPFVLLNYLCIGKQSLQILPSFENFMRPHSGALYYEKRGFLEWERMLESLLFWMMSARYLR